MGALPLLVLVLGICGHARSTFPLRPSYSLYAGGHAPAHGTRAASRHRNWCAVMVTKRASCTVEDGLETYMKADYHPCSWGSGLCSRGVLYRTYVRPRYMVTYKIVTELEWRCCHGYSGADCSVGPVGGAGGHVSSTYPHQPGGSSGLGVGGPESGGHGGLQDSEKMRQLEDRVQVLMKNLQQLQTTVIQHFHQETNRPGVSGGAGAAGGPGGRNPADAAQPQIKDTIHSIQTKLDQLDNRTQAHDQTLVSINNHLVNHRGTQLDGAPSGGGGASLKEEVLRQLESSVSLSCSSCQAGVEDLLRQQQLDRDRIRSLEKQLDSLNIRHRQDLDQLRRDVLQAHGCCGAVRGLRDRLDATEWKISSTSEDLDRLAGAQQGGRGGEDGLSQRLKDLRVQVSDQTFRVHQVELEVQRAQTRLENHGGRLQRLENGSALVPWRTGGGGASGGGAGLPGRGGANTTQKSLEWRVVANEDQIRHISTRLKDLSVSGDSLHDKVLDLDHDVGKIKSVTGERSEHFQRLLMKLRILGEECEACGRVEEDLQRVRNHSQDALGRMQSHVERIQTRLEAGGCSQTCWDLRDQVQVLLKDAQRCTDRCRPGSGPVPGPGSGGLGPGGPGSGGPGGHGSGGPGGPGPGSAGPGGQAPSLDPDRPLDGHSVVGGPPPTDHLKTLQGQLSQLLLTFSFVNDTLRGLEHSVHKHHSVITDLGNTKDKIISELDKIQQEVTEHAEDSRERMDRMDGDVRRFENRLLVEIGDCRRSGDGLEKRLSKLEDVCRRLDGVSGSISKMKGGLDKHMSGLWTCVSGLNESIVHHRGVLDSIQKNQDHIHGRMKNLNSSLTQVLRDLQGSSGSKGGAGLPGSPAHVPRLSFSAALSVPMDQAGTVVFDKIFVNDGGFYNPRTGVFTAPASGRYLFSAVLTGYRNQKLEVVLSRSNHGVARGDSGGYQPEALENKPVAESRPPPGSLAVFSLVLPMRRQDTVCIELVSGRLAHGVEPLSIFSGTLLYPDQ